MNVHARPVQGVAAARRSKRRHRIWSHRFYFYLIIPGLLYFLIIDYVPMFGVIIAFKDISPFGTVGEILTGPWVGLKHFVNFWHSIYFWNVMRNTLVISMLKLAVGFPASILLALLLNEVRNSIFKRFVQTVSYLPHFISNVVMAGLVMTILSTDGGLVNALITALGGKAIYFLGEPSYFRSVLVSSHVWQSVGWGSILYLAAISGIDPGLYEAATIDGANRFRQAIHITIPGISHIIVILLIYSIGGLLSAGFEQILLLYSPPVYGVSDIIDTFVYREGLTNMKYSFVTAVGLFKNILAMVLILGANYIAKRFNQTGIW